MTIVKEEARKLIDKLPKTATWDDIMYVFYVKQKISKGLAELKAGKVVSHKEAKKRLLSK